MKKNSEAAGEGRVPVTENRKARFNYQILESIEAGIVLTGAEIKSIRAHGMSVDQSYVRPQGGELFLLGAHIQPYSFSTEREYDPTRPRKLLLNRREIDKFVGSIERKGLTIVPLRVYLLRGRAKVEIALARGKSAPDKRDAIHERDDRRALDRLMKSRTR